MGPCCQFAECSLWSFAACGNSLGCLGVHGTTLANNSIVCNSILVLETLFSDKIWPVGTQLSHYKETLLGFPSCIFGNLYLSRFPHYDCNAHQFQLSLPPFPSLTLLPLATWSFVAFLRCLWFFSSSVEALWVSPILFSMSTVVVIVQLLYRRGLTILWDVFQSIWYFSCYCKCCPFKVSFS